MIKIFGGLFLFFLASSVNAQLVNIESQRMQTDNVRFVLKSDFLFNYSNNDGIYIYRFDIGLATQYKFKNMNNTVFFIGNYGLIRSEGLDYQNSWFLHLRYNRKLGQNKRFRLESFIQDQSNELLSINSRNLIGLGLRYKFVKGDYFHAYVGNSYMYEKEVSEIVDQKYYNHRNNTYLSLTLRLPKSGLELLNTVYFQPLYTDISNFRILEQFKAEMPLFGNLRVSALFNYFYNNLNPLGTSEFTSNMSVGLTYQIEASPPKQKYIPAYKMY
jgi:hypothetical protein